MKNAALRGVLIFWLVNERLPQKRFASNAGWPYMNGAG
jgi:hypothetical protein